MARRNTDSFSAQRSAKRKGKPRGKPFAKGNPYRIKPGTILNPGGKTRRVGNSYALWLSLEDELGKANADKIAEVVGELALSGDYNAYKEIRQATEGDKVFTYDPGTLTDEQLDRIISGERPDNVIASDSHSGEGEAPTNEQDSSSADPASPNVDSV